MFKKENKIMWNVDYSAFVMVMVILSEVLSTVHSIESPAWTFNICAIFAGTLVLTDLLFELPLDNFVFCLNNTVIPPIFIDNYNYICTTKYINIGY